PRPLLKKSQNFPRTFLRLFAGVSLLFVAYAAPKYKRNASFWKESGGAVRGRRICAFVSPLGVCRALAHQHRHSTETHRRACRTCGVGAVDALCFVGGAVGVHRPG